MNFLQILRDGFNTIYAFFRKSLSGDQQDFTKGSIPRAVFLLAIPMILEMCMESVFAVVDIFFVGRIGKEAVATVGLTESVLALVYSVAVGLSMAATAIVSRRVGEKDREGAARSAVQSILIALCFTVLVSVSGYLLAPRILQSMGAPDQVVQIGSSYTRIMFGGAIVIMLLYLINGIFRGAGNATIAMWSLWIANGFNIILCPVLIHRYGLPGAAMATTIGRGIGVMYQLFHLVKGNGVIRIVMVHFIPDWKLIKNIFAIASTGTFQFLIGSASWIVMARIVANFGSEVIAGYQVAIRVIIFFLLPAWGMSNAAATLVGQNLGAGQPMRAQQSVWKVAKYNVVFMALVSLLFLVASGPIVRFMNHDPGVDRVAVQALQIISTGYIFFGVGMVVTNAFNGAGDTRTPVYINLVCFWIFQIPFAYFLAITLAVGPKAVFFAIVITESLVTILSVYIFRKGRWKTIKV